MPKKRGPGEGTIYKLPNGKYRTQITIDGKREGITGTYKECLDWRLRMLEQMRKGLTWDMSQVTFEEFLERWLESVRLNLRDTTIYLYEHHARTFIIPALGKIKLSEIKPHHIQKFYNDLARRDVGPFTIRKIHEVNVRALNYAMGNGLIYYNPIKGVIAPKMPSYEMQVLDSEQVNRFLVACKGHRYEALFTLAVATGMRQMELLGLKWNDIDWDNSTIIVRNQLKRKRRGEDFEWLPLKTKYSLRRIAIGPRVLATLREHWEKQLEQKAFMGSAWKDYGSVFASNIGTPIFPRNMLEDFKAILKAAGLPAIRFHDLRHTAASLMLNAGIPPIVVSRILGHSSPSVTMNIYGHLMPQSQIEAAMLMNEVVTPISVDIEVGDES